MKPNRNRTRDLGFYALLLIIMVAVIFTMTRTEPANEVKSYSDLVDLFQQEKVKYFATRPGSSGTVLYLEVRTDDPEATEEMTYDLYNFSVFYEDFHELIAEQYEAGIIKEYDYNPESQRFDTYVHRQHAGKQRCWAQYEDSAHKHQQNNGEYKHHLTGIPAHILSHNVRQGDTTLTHAYHT